MRLFSDRGSDVSIAEIAAAAGVGKATVYRSFPSKDDLLGAVALQRHAWFGTRIAAALGEPTAWQAFERLVLDLSARLERDRTLGQVLREAPALPELQAAKAASRNALQELLDRAIEEGAMRENAAAGDVGILLSGYSISLTNTEAPAADWERLAHLVIDAFRTR